MSGNVIRTMGAFVAGLVLALAGALVYVRIHEREQMTQEAAVQVAPEEPSAAQEPAQIPQGPPHKDLGTTLSEPGASQAPIQDSQPTEPQRAQPARVMRDVPKAVKHHPSKRTAPPVDGPVQVVQNTAPKSADTSISPTEYPATSQSQQGAVQATSSPAITSAAPQPHVVQLTAGTNLVIRLGETVSTDHNYTDDAFRGTLDQPIIRDGFIIADKGSKVLGRVVEADKAGRVRGVANLRLALTEINTTDGQRIEIDTNTVEKEGSRSTGRDSAKIAGGAALGAIIGALGGGGKGAAIGAGAGGAAGTGLVLATRGKAAVLPSESRLTFQLADPVTITKKLNR